MDTTVAGKRKNTFLGFFYNVLAFFFKAKSITNNPTIQIGPFKPELFSGFSTAYGYKYFTAMIGYLRNIFLPQFKI